MDILEGKKSIATSQGNRILCSNELGLDSTEKTNLDDSVASSDGDRLPRSPTSIVDSVSLPPDLFRFSHEKKQPAYMFNNDETGCHFALKPVLQSDLKVKKASLICLSPGSAVISDVEIIENSPGDITQNGVSQADACSKEKSHKLGLSQEEIPNEDDICQVSTPPTEEDYPFDETSVGEVPFDENDLCHFESLNIERSNVERNSDNETHDSAADVQVDREAKTREKKNHSVDESQKAINKALPFDQVANQARHSRGTWKNHNAENEAAISDGAHGHEDRPISGAASGDDEGLIGLQFL